MKLDFYGYKFIVTPFESAGVLCKTKIVVTNDINKAYEHFCDILDSGITVGILAWKHGHITGAATTTVEEHLDVGSKEAWRITIDRCKIFNSNVDKENETK